MSTQIFPALPGLGWSVKRTPVWKTRKQESISGKRTSIADWSFPRWEWEITFDFLRQAGTGQQSASFAGASYAEFASLAGFFNLRSGAFDSFLYQDADDNTVVNQTIGTGDGSTTLFQLVRAFGGFVEPIYAPTNISAVFVNGINIGSAYSVSSWGLSLTPGIITLNTPAGAGQTVAASFTYAFPCQFDDDRMTFEKFMAALYAAKSVKFSTLK